MIYAIGRGNILVAPVGLTVWQTEAAAQAHLSMLLPTSGYILYEVLADWQKDTKKVSKAEWRTLSVETIMMPIKVVRSR